MHNGTVSPMRNFTGVSAVYYHYCVHVIESVLRSGTRCAACPTKALALSSPEDPGQGAAATRLAESCLREYGTSAMHRKEEESGRVEKAGGGREWGRAGRDEGTVGLAKSARLMYVYPMLFSFSRSCGEENRRNGAPIRVSANVNCQLMSNSTGFEG